jgi:hypothetical protein
MENQNNQQKPPPIIQPVNNPVDTTSKPNAQVTVSRFVDGPSRQRAIVHKLKLPILIVVSLILLSTIGSGSYMLYKHALKSASVLSPIVKSNNNSTTVTSSNSAPPSPTQSTTSAPTSSTPVSSTPKSTSQTTKTPTVTTNPSSSTSSSNSSSTTTSTPPAFAAIADAPTFTDEGSYAATSGSLSGTGQCKFQITLPFSINGPGTVGIEVFQSTNYPDNNWESYPYPSGGFGAGINTYSQAGQYSVVTTIDADTSYGIPSAVFTDFFTVINQANSQVLATSPTGQFDCP